jgi:phospholipid/cholesterol/gamma-HCH transport system substrate-binding protein
MKGLRTITVKFIAFALCAGMLGLLTINTMLNAVDGDTSEYTAMFANSSGLRSGDDVKVAGVRVGRVTDIEVAEVDNRQVSKVTFELSDDQPILQNSKLVMRYADLLGSRYLSIQQPQQRAAALPKGAELGLSQTDPGFDLTVLLNGFRPLFRVLKPEDVNQLAETLVKVLQGEGGTLQEFLRETTKLTNFVADRDQVFDQVITNLTPVLENLAGQGDELRTTARELTALMSALAKERETIGGSIDGIAQLTDHLSALFVQANQPTKQALVRLRAVAKMYKDNRTEVENAIVWFPRLVTALGRITQNSNQANVYFCNLGLNLAGTTVYPWGQPGSANYSEVCR